MPKPKAIDLEPQVKDTGPEKRNLLVAFVSLWLLSLRSPLQEAHWTLFLK